ncbi:type III secretion system inner membrane ring subunit SctD [Pantoea stewartii]|nr:type III secretion system inner membrane ring subunit SctD [Pantoea stewartii]KAB0556782.1 EscD/YscD/HrpQ family type III secretion system inner membrane ring protein [Pantoea stewartii subsp. stewartii]
MNSEWKIRLLGGVLHGREVWLADGHLSVGERGCDLCIPLCGGDRLEFTATPEGLMINTGNAPVWVNGRRHQPDKPLPEEGVVHALGLTMAFGQHHANLSRYPLPRTSPALFWGMAFACLILMGAAGLVLLCRGTPPSPPPMPSRVAELLQQNGLTQVAATWEKNGTLRLSGYCEKSDRLQSVRLKLGAWGVLYQDNVECTDQLIRQVRDVLTQAGYDEIELTSHAPGEISINADIMMGKRWAGIQQQLTTIPGLKHLHIDNLHETQINALIASLLQQRLAEKVSVTSVGQAFVISGVLNMNEQQSLNHLLAQLRQQFPGIALSYQNVASSGEGIQRFPSPIAAIVHGQQGLYLLLEDGERLRTGSQLPQGGEVVALTDAAVALRFPDALVNYSFNF